MPQQTQDISQQIWRVVAMIPVGKVSTYGDIARLAGLPGGARRVGYALRGLPADTTLPWHRVINAQGQLSLPADGEAGRRQRARLEAEGIAFSAAARINLQRFRWQP